MMFIAQKSIFSFLYLPFLSPFLSPKAISLTHFQWKNDKRKMLLLPPLLP
jgi:hypothetical protein